MPHTQHCGEILLCVHFQAVGDTVLIVHEGIGTAFVQCVKGVRLAKFLSIGEAKTRIKIWVEFTSELTGVNDPLGRLGRLRWRGRPGRSRCWNGGWPWCSRPRRSRRWNGRTRSSRRGRITPTRRSPPHTLIQTIPIHHPNIITTQFRTPKHHPLIQPFVPPIALAETRIYIGIELDFGRIVVRIGIRHAFGVVHPLVGAA
mmetsp:Transcript_26253/g.48289  ORF Transcript_26253/g.48289 Transcript_26253/m.48289 type:complete len:201 (-) Transcript_26253:722-1324(-)